MKGKGGTLVDDLIALLEDREKQEMMASRHKSVRQLATLSCHVQWEDFHERLRRGYAALCRVQDKDKVKD